MFNLEKSITRWLRLFNKHRAFDDGAIHEMELHLRDHIDDLIADGYDQKEAFDMAVREFGEIPVMANEEFTNIKTKAAFLSLSYPSMMNNHLKTSIRSVLRNPLSSFINIFGLSVAIGVCLVVYAFFEYDHQIDRFHENKDNVFLVTFFGDRDGSQQQYGTTPKPLGARLRKDFTQVKSVCRIEDRDVVVKYGEQVFHENVRYVDPEFLEMFTFPLKWGLSNSLSDPNSIILSAEMAIKYFGEGNPIGENLIMFFGEGNFKSFTIKGVANPFPKAHIIDFEFLVNFENLRVSDPEMDLQDWSGFIAATFIQVENPGDLGLIQDGMAKYKALQNQVQPDWPIKSFQFEPLAELHARSGMIRNDISYDDNEEARTGLPVVAAFMLILACFNYINMAIASAAKRLKEIGVRKVVGASRLRIVLQFLSENVFMTLFALLIGLILTVSIFLPWFSELSGEPLELHLIDPKLWIFIVAIVVVTGIASALYPAFYISKFRATNIFRGSVRFGRKNPLTKTLLGLQLVLTITGITGAVIYAQNNAYQNNQSWGYAQKEALYVQVQNFSAYEELSALMGQDPNVIAVSGSAHHLGKSHESEIIHLPGREYEVRQMSVEANYLKTMGIKLKSGRHFREGKNSDNQAVIVNELMVKNLELTQPIGQIVTINNIRFEIIAVVENFHIYNFGDEIQPTFFKVADPQDYRYLSMKVVPGSNQATFDNLQKIWSSLFPEIPFQGGHQQDVWPTFFTLLDTAQRFFTVLAGIGIMLASMGLYGLVTVNVAGRIREFSIRKALGAGTRNIAANIARQYLVLTGLSMIVGIPFSYWLIDANLKDLYAYPMPMTVSGMLISVVILIGVLLMVISTQVKKVASASPVDGLKVE